MTKISIITTTYKHENFIKYTIESILSQTFTDWELLIGDDSPDDLTWNIIQTYVSKYPEKIKAWHHSPNLGIVDNMNFLLENVNHESEYIAFLEGDDMFTPDNLQQKINIFGKYPDVKLVYSDFEFIDENNKFIKGGYNGIIPFKNNHNNTIDDFFRSHTNIYSYSSGMLKNEVLKELGGIPKISNDKLFSVSDYDLYFRIITKYKTYGINKVLMKYRKHQTNLSFSNHGKIANDLGILFNYYYKNNFISEKQYKISMSGIEIAKSSGHIEKFDKLNAIKHLLLSFKYKLLLHYDRKIRNIILILIPSFLLKYLLNKFYYKK